MNDKPKRHGAILRHPIFKEMRRLVMTRLDKIEPKDVVFKLFYDDDTEEEITPEERRLLPGVLGVEFKTVFKETKYIARTEMYLEDKLFSFINNPVEVHKGYGLRMIVQFEMQSPNIKY